MPPTVSIVLPCYNGSGHLAQSIESVMAQTFQDWELIVVNDCSKDNSLEIMQSYAEKDSRIRVINNTVNKKLPASLNVGFAEAKGKYLTWTSHDNRMGETMLEKFVQYLDSHAEIGLVTANYAAFSLKTGERLYEVSMDDPQERLPHHNTICYAFMYRREVLETIGGYDENLFLIEDYEYWVRIWLKFKIGKVDKTLYYTGVGDETLTMSRKKEIAKRLLDVRLMYFDDFDKALKPTPLLRRDFFISIANELSGIKWLGFVLKCSMKCSGRFGLYYTFWYAPKHFVKRFGFYQSIRKTLKHA